MLPTGLLTLDVEDWDHANYAQLDGRGPEVTRAFRHKMYAMDANVDRWIELCAAAGARSTCFVLGQFAQRYPHAVGKLHRAGHEIASHCYSHDLIYQMSQERFRDDLKRALGVLGELTGEQPRGFRAPSWSVDDARTPWFCDELAAAGVAYDSSEFPVRTPLFGVAGAPLEPYRRAGVLRVPVTVLTCAGARLPFASGAFFRLAPLWLIRAGLAQATRKGRPAMIVLHPRELDPEHPRLPLRGWESWVHYARLHTTVPKLRALLPTRRWVTLREAIPELEAGIPLAGG